MDNEPNTHDSTTDAHNDAFPVGENAQSPPEIKTAKEIITNPLSQKYTSPNPKNDEGHCEKEKPGKPLQVRLIRNDELNSFERKTIGFGRYGVSIAAASFIAAVIAACVIFGQLKEMSNQTDLLGIAARQARIDAKNSAITTARQLSELDEQVTIARSTFNAMNRPYVGIEGIDTGYENEKLQRVGAQAGRSMMISTHIKNFGPVAGTKFRAVEKLFINGKEVGSNPVASQKFTLYPTEIVMIPAVIGERDYPNIVSRRAILVLELTIQYSGPSAAYKECTKQQYEPDIATFLSLGPSCSAN